MSTDFRSFGGVALESAKSGKMLSGKDLKDALADPNATVAWNFGIDATMRQRVGLDENAWATLQKNRADRMLAKLPLKEWDGKTSTKRNAMTKRIKHHGKAGEFLPAQYQPNGTCVGRGASGALNVFQAILCLAGFPLEWLPVSHAWCYAGARMQYNDLGPGDGAVGSGAFEWCRDKGVTFQAESGDSDYYKDQVAVQWATRGIPASIIPLGKDNPITDAFPVTTAKQAADVLFSGGAVTIASSQGFRQQRDEDGVDSPAGTWMHQMHLVDVRVTSKGRKVLDCVQSWGEDGGGIRGSLAPDQPAYVFGIDWDVADRMLRQGDSMGAMSFEGWLDQLPWATGGA